MFAPMTDFTLLTGEGKLTEYRFNTEKIAHRFCTRCGVECFGQGEKPDGSATVAINIRTIDALDLSSITRTPVDGRSF